jgi:hypothetical protein
MIFAKAIRNIELSLDLTDVLLTIVGGGVMVLNCDCPMHTIAAFYFH